MTSIYVFFVVALTSIASVAVGAPTSDHVVRGTVDLSDALLPYVDVQVVSSSNGQVLHSYGMNRLGVQHYFELPRVDGTLIRLSISSLPKAVVVDKTGSVLEVPVSKGEGNVEGLKLRLKTLTGDDVVPARGGKSKAPKTESTSTASWSSSIITVAVVVSLFLFKDQVLNALEGISRGPRRMMVQQVKIRR